MEFNIVDKLLGLTLLGTEWVLWLLLILSVLSVTIILERLVFFFKSRINFSDFSETMARKLSSGDIEGLGDACRQFPALETQMVMRGLEEREKGSKAMDQRMKLYLAGEMRKLDRGLVILGTLGNNAPFIGLFGTVIGIIQAFADLANNPAGGPSVVMAGISEALVATAVGLLVAIPAVVAYNAFQKGKKNRLANADSLRQIVVSHFNS